MDGERDRLEILQRVKVRVRLAEVRQRQIV